MGKSTLWGPMLCVAACGGQAPNDSSSTVPEDSLATAIQSCEEFEVLAEWSSSSCNWAVTQPVEESDTVRSRQVADYLDEAVYSDTVPLDSPGGISTAPWIETGRLYGGLYWDFSVDCDSTRGQGHLSGLSSTKLVIPELGIDGEFVSERAYIYVWSDETFTTTQFYVADEDWAGDGQILVEFVHGSDRATNLWASTEAECLVFYTAASAFGEQKELCP